MPLPCILNWFIAQQKRLEAKSPGNKKAQGNKQPVLEEDCLVKKTNSWKALQQQDVGLKHQEMKHFNQAKPT